MIFCNVCVWYSPEMKWYNDNPNLIFYDKYQSINEMKWNVSDTNTNDISVMTIQYILMKYNDINTMILLLMCVYSQ